MSKKRFKFELVVDEQNNGFWEELRATNKSGCDEICNWIKAVLDKQVGLDYYIKLVEYTDK